MIKMALPFLAITMTLFSITDIFAEKIRDHDIVLDERGRIFNTRKIKSNIILLIQLGLNSSGLPLNRMSSPMGTRFRRTSGVMATIAASMGF